MTKAYLHVPPMRVPHVYIRSDDGAEMIEISPHVAVNVKAALNFRLVSPETVKAARAATESEQ
jgi:hypothetical protein